LLYISSCRIAIWGEEEKCKNCNVSEPQSLSHQNWNWGIAWRI
jgi:hypothetical protein